LISGNHHNLDVRNAKGEDFVYLAQTATNWAENRLMVAHGIRSVSDLKGKQVVVDNLTMLKDHATPILHLRSDEEVEALYEEWGHSLEPKPYPSIEAIANVFWLAVRRNPEIASFNPLALWDNHYVAELDDSGYIDQLYRQKNGYLSCEFRVFAPAGWDPAVNSPSRESL
jgi:hypothetical protein